MFTSLALFSALVAPSHAGNQLPLTSAEVGNSAHVLEDGYKFHTLGLKYSLGLNDTTQLNVRTLYEGPGAGLEKMILDQDRHAASVYLDLTAFYLRDGGYAGIEGGAIYTLGGPDTHRLNLSAGASYRRTYFSPEPIFELTTSVGLAWHLRASDKTTVELYGTVDPYNTLTGSALEGSAGVRWIHAFWREDWSDVRVSLGLEMRTGETWESVLAAAGLDVDVPVMPLPTASVWWRF